MQYSSLALYSLRNYKIDSLDGVCVCVCRYFFRSGNIEHPGDKLFNTTVEVLPFDVSLCHCVQMNTSSVFVEGSLLFPSGQEETASLHPL